MPTYEYKCTECNYIFETFQLMSAEPLKECPQCKGSLRRLIGAGAGPIFKGSGFYQTDYKNNNNGNGKSKTSNNENKKSEAKPVENKSTETKKQAD